MTALSEAEALLDGFKKSVLDSQPRLPDDVFERNPGVEFFILQALTNFRHAALVLEQSKPAKRVSLTDDAVPELS